MEIIYEIPKRVRFEELELGDSFEAIKGVALMKIEKCYKVENHKCMCNAVELETGALKYVYPADQVIPIKITGNVIREVITC